MAHKTEDFSFADIKEDDTDDALSLSQTICTNQNFNEDFFAIQGNSSRGLDQTGTFLGTLSVSDDTLDEVPGTQECATNQGETSKETASSGEENVHNLEKTAPPAIGTLERVRHELSGGILTDEGHFNPNLARAILSYLDGGGNQLHIQALLNPPVPVRPENRLDGQVNGQPIRPSITVNYSPASYVPAANSHIHSAYQPRDVYVPSQLTLTVPGLDGRPRVIYRN